MLIVLSLAGLKTGVLRYVSYYRGSDNQQKIKDEKRQIEALIKQTTKDIDQIRGHCKRFKKNISEKVPNPGEWLDHNPIREPLMLEKLLSNDLFAKYCIIASTYLFNELSNIKPALNRINNSETPQEWRMDAVGIYSLELEHIKDLLDNSRGLPDGSKGEKDFEELENWKDLEEEDLNKSEYQEEELLYMDAFLLKSQVIQ